MHIARETAGAARTRSSLRPVFEGKVFFQNFGRDAPRECEVVFRPMNIIARSVADRSNPSSLVAARWIASLALAMTRKRRRYRNFHRSPGTTRQASTVLLPRTLHEPTSTGRRGGTRAQRPARRANAGADRTGRPACMDRMSHFAMQQFERMAPAKGAMAIRPASLYWCGWHTSFGAGYFPRPAKIARED